MNIQDLISTIINYVKNMDKKDLVIFILIALLFYRTRNVEGNENVAIDDSTLNSSHLAAIRNLGNLAKSLQDGNNIVLPGDVKINGKLSVGPNEDIKIFSDGRSKISMKMDDKVGTIQAYKQGDIYRLYFDDKIDELYVKGNINGESDLNVNKNLTVNGLVNNDLTVNNNLTVNGESTFKGKSTFKDDANFNDNAQIQTTGHIKTQDNITIFNRGSYGGGTEKIRLKQNGTIELRPVPSVNPISWYHVNKYLKPDME